MAKKNKRAKAPKPRKGRTLGGGIDATFAAAMERHQHGYFDEANGGTREKCETEGQGMWDPCGCSEFAGWGETSSGGTGEQGNDQGSGGDDVIVGHRAILHGCTIGNDVLVGNGAIVMDGAVIEDRVVIGAGALVPPGKHLETGFLYIGSPARQTRPRVLGRVLGLRTGEPSPASHIVPRHA